MAQVVYRRYAEIMRDVEALVNDHSRSLTHHLLIISVFPVFGREIKILVDLTEYYPTVRHQILPEDTSKLKMLVPSIGSFFTPLHLEAAFMYQDQRRAISCRRFVAPSFNDVRIVLNTAQIMALVRPVAKPDPSNLIASLSERMLMQAADATGAALQLLTFDGDVTLYDDGASLTPDNPVIPRLIYFLSYDICIGIVTAAGYTDAAKYHQRLHGLLDAISASSLLSTTQKHNLIIMGGESNFLFVFDESCPHLLRYIHRRDWILPVMHGWDESSIQSLLDVAQSALETCIHTLNLPALVLRKERAVGIYPAPIIESHKAPKSGPISTSATATTPAPIHERQHQPQYHTSTTTTTSRLSREQLEETVLTVQQVMDRSPIIRASGIPFCAFNGGRDVFVDIGDKSLGVRACQSWFFGARRHKDEKTKPESEAATASCPSLAPSPAMTAALATTLHVGDQFLSGGRGSNDFKARLASTTAWITSPEETVELLDEMIALHCAPVLGSD
jgi:IMP and pyridine-specific 5'-nucleotidase